MFHDFDIFLQAGQAVLNGQSPYTSVTGYFYPYPTTYLFALLALLPPDWAKGVWTAFSIGVLIFVTRKAAPLWLIFPPVIACLIQGQLDLAMLGLWALAGGTATPRGKGDVLPGIALALMTLKPQLGFLIIPYQLWHWRTASGARTRWITFAFTLLVIFGIPTLLWPGWVMEFLQHGRPISYAMTIAPSVFLITQYALWLWPVSLLLAAGLCVWVLRQAHTPGIINTTSFIINPTTHIYNLAMLADNLFLWRTVALCLPLYLVTLIIATPDQPFWAHAPFVLAPILALWERLRYQPKPV